MSDTANIDDLPAPGETLPGLTQVPTNAELQQRVVSVNRTIGDLPDLPNKMNTIGVVLSYELFGLGIADTAAVTGLTDEQVGRIRMLDAYDAMRKDVVGAILERDAEDVRDLFQQHARNAATRVAGLVDSERPDIALAASKDMLDRAGHMPKHIMEHNHRLEGGLIIEHVRRDNSKDVPVIDMKDVTDG